MVKVMVRYKILTESLDLVKIPTDSVFQKKWGGGSRRLTPHTPPSRHNPCVWVSRMEYLTKEYTKAGKFVKV